MQSRQVTLLILNLNFKFKFFKVSRTEITTLSVVLYDQSFIARGFTQKRFYSRQNFVTN